MLVSADEKSHLNHLLVQIWDRESGQLYGCIGATTSPHEKNYSLSKLVRIDLGGKTVIFVRCEICRCVEILNEKDFGFKPAPK